MLTCLLSIFPHNFDRVPKEVVSKPEEVTPEVPAVNEIPLKPFSMKQPHARRISSTKRLSKLLSSKTYLLCFRRFERNHMRIFCLSISEWDTHSERMDLQCNLCSTTVYLQNILEKKYGNGSQICKLFLIGVMFL